MPQGNPYRRIRPGRTASARVRSGLSSGRVSRLPTVITVGVNGISDTSANIVGSVDPNGSATSWWIAYGTSLPLTLTAGAALYPSVSQTTNPVPNPSFAYDSVGSTPAAYTEEGALLSTYQVQAGGGLGSAQSLRMTLPTQAAAFQIPGAQSVTIPVTSGQIVSFAASVNVLSLVGTAEAILGVFWNGMGSLVEAVTTTTTGVQQLSQLNVTVPPATTSMTLFIGWDTGTNASANAAADGYFGSVIIAQGPVLPSYFDGDTPGYEWSGTPGDSASVPRPDYGLVASAPSVGSGTTPITVTYELTGLTTNATYYVAVVGQSSAGTVYGQTVSFLAQAAAAASTQPVVPYGQSSVTIPHFNMPFSLVASGTQSGVVVVEQDTVEEILANVNTIAACEIGQCPQLPAFGRPQEIFLQGPPDTTALVAAIQLWEPRAQEDAIVQLLPDGQTWGITLETSSAGSQGA